MRKIKLLLFLICLSLIMPGIKAQEQDTLRSLIFSEWRGGWARGDNYMEFANVGDDTLDLSRFMVQWINGNGQQLAWENEQWRYATPALTGRLYMNGMLPPGETYLIYSEQGNTRDDLYAIADTTSVNADRNLLFNYGGHKHILYYFLDNGDSIVIDVANLLLNEALQTVNAADDVAGVAACTRTHTLVRKANIKQGNVDWENSKGVSPEDSEWIVIPNQRDVAPRDEFSFTTTKTHGDFNIDVQSEDVNINEGAKTMEVPWGTYKRDSLINILSIGPGMAWQYLSDTTSYEDSAHVIVQDGDILNLFAAGNEMRMIDFQISLKEPASDLANIFPLLRKNIDGNWVQVYDVLTDLYLTDTSGVITDTVDYILDPEGIDTIGYVIDTVGFVIDTIGPAPDMIGNVPYATRVDSLFKYLEKAPKATWEIDWVDDTERPDLVYGDILKVTAEDGTVHEYVIDVAGYLPNSNPLLGAITWPDKTDFLENWKGDTIPQFDPNKTIYTIELPYGTTSVPALVAHTQSVNATVDISRATTLSGSLENRTTIFNVMPENPDTFNMVYSVIFEVEKDPAKIQDWEGTPFFSEIVTTMRSWQFCVEIVNPGTTPLDLSEYMIVRGLDVIPAADLVALVPEAPTDADFQNRYRSYVPGYKYYDDTTNWVLNPGILSVDADVNPTVDPGGVFVIAAATNNRGDSWTEAELEIFDKEWHDSESSATISDDGVNVRNVAALPKRGSESMYLWKIENDSILEGTKAVGDADDYTLVDMIGDPVADLIWSVAGVSYIDNSRTTTRRKPDIYKGVTNPIESLEAFGAVGDSSDADLSHWIVDLFTTANNGIMTDYIGSHIMNPVTLYISTVTSPVYLVSDGYAGEQDIQGDLASITVSEFYANVTKADTGQVFTLKSGVDGSEKGADDPVVGTDQLVVVSADGMNTTTYTLIDLPIDSNALLELVGDDTGLTISTLTDSTGSITGVIYGSMLKDLSAAVKTVSANAVLNIIDGEGNLIPLQIMNTDSVKVPTVVGDDVYFEVTAQDKVTVMTYKLEPASMASDAFIISSIYAVDQEMSDIAGLMDGTATSTFFASIEVVKGASARLLNKLGQERMDGQLAYDDVLQVMSEDGSAMKTYFITFMNESTPDANQAPEIMLTFTDTTFADPGTIMLSATATDDNLPPPPSLTYLWEVSTDNAADVVIENADQLETNVTFNAKGHYTVTLYVSDGDLTSQADVRVKVGAVGIESILTSSLHIYPNPAKDKLTLELVNMPENSSTVSIYSITGSTVYNEKLSTQSTEIDLSGFESGLYFIKLTSGDRSFTQRVEIQK